MRTQDELGNRMYREIIDSTNRKPCSVDDPIHFQIKRCGELIENELKIEREREGRRETEIERDREVEDQRREKRVIERITMRRRTNGSTNSSSRG
jgi:hypothetical protein